MISLGYAFAILLPVVGVIIGVILLNNGPRDHGIAVTVLSVVVLVVSYVWLF